MQTIKRTSANPEFGRGLSKKPERVTRQTPHSVPILTHYPRNYKRKHRKIRIVRPKTFAGWMWRQIFLGLALCVGSLTALYVIYYWIAIPVMKIFCLIMGVD